MNQVDDRVVVQTYHQVKDEVPFQVANIIRIRVWNQVDYQARLLRIRVYDQFYDQFKNMK